MGQPQAPPSPADSASVVGVLDAFLDWCLRHKAGRTYDWYRDYLESFARTLPREFETSRLKPYHVQQWLDGHPGGQAVFPGAHVHRRRDARHALADHQLGRRQPADRQRQRRLVQRHPPIPG